MIGSAFSRSPRPISPARAASWIALPSSSSPRCAVGETRWSARRMLAGAVGDFKTSPNSNRPTLFNQASRPSEAPALRWVDRRSVPRSPRRVRPTERVEHGERVEVVSPPSHLASFDRRPVRLARQQRVYERRRSRAGHRDPRASHQARAAAQPPSARGGRGSDGDRLLSPPDRRGDHVAASLRLRRLRRPIPRRPSHCTVSRAAAARSARQLLAAACGWWCGRDQPGLVGKDDDLHAVAEF